MSEAQADIEFVVAMAGDQETLTAAKRSIYIQKVSHFLLQCILLCLQTIFGLNLFTTFFTVRNETDCEFFLTMQATGGNSFYFDGENLEHYIIKPGQVKILALAKEFNSILSSPMLTFSGIAVVLGRPRSIWPAVITIQKSKDVYKVQGEGVSIAYQLPHLKGIGAEEDEKTYEWNGSKKPERWNEEQILAANFRDWSYWLQSGMLYPYTHLDWYKGPKEKPFGDVEDINLKRMNQEEGDIIWDRSRILDFNRLYYMKRTDSNDIPEGELLLGSVPQDNVLATLGWRLSDLYNEIGLLVLELVSNEDGLATEGLFFLSSSAFILMFFNGIRPPLSKDKSDTWYGTKDNSLSYPIKMFHFVLPMLIAGIKDLVSLGQTATESPTRIFVWIVAQMYLFIGTFSLICLVEGEARRPKGFMACSQGCPGIAKSSAVKYLCFLLVLCIPVIINVIAYYDNHIARNIASGLLLLTFYVRFLLEPWLLDIAFRSSSLYMPFNLLILPIVNLIELILGCRLLDAVKEMYRKLKDAVDGHVNTLAFIVVALLSIAVSIVRLENDVYM